MNAPVGRIEPGLFMDRQQVDELHSLRDAMQGAAHLMDYSNSIPPQEQIAALMSVFALRIEGILGCEMPEVNWPD